MKLSKVKKIVFLNTAAEADVYAGSVPGGPCGSADTLLIAMSPQVYSHLRAKNMAAEDTLAYFTSDSHAAALERSDRIMEWLRREFDAAGLGLDSLWAHRESFVFWLRCPILYFLWVIEVVSNAIAAHDPEVLVASSFGGIPEASLFIEPREKYLGSMVKSIVEERGIRYEDVGHINNSPVASSIAQTRDYLLSAGRYIIRYKAFQLWRLFLWLRRLASGKQYVFFTTKLYQMQRLSEEARRHISGQSVRILKGPAVSFVKMPGIIAAFFPIGYSKSVAEKRAQLEKFALKLRDAKDIFSFKGVSFSEALSKKVSDNYVGYMTGLYLWAGELKRFLGLLRPRAVISSGSRSDDLVIGELCERLGIPAAMIPHGSNIEPKNCYENIEWGENGIPQLRGPFSFIALQTPLTEGYLKIFPARGRSIKTGPLIWGMDPDKGRSGPLIKNIFGEKGRNNRKVLLHAGTPKATNALRLYVYETSDEYIRSIKDLAQAIENMPDAVLIVKFRPSHEISINDMKSRIAFSDKVKLCTEGSFTDLLGISDLVVSFSSTAIEEALQNKVPVLLYGGDGRYQHVPAFEIKGNSAVERSAAYFIRNARDLSYGISEILGFNINRLDQGGLFKRYIYDDGVKISFNDFLAEVAGNSKTGITR